MNESAYVRQGDALNCLHEQGKRRAQKVPDFDIEETLSKVRAAAAADAHALGHRQPEPSWGVALPAKGRVCVMFAADIAGFTRPDRDEEIQSHLRHVLYGTLREAFAGSGIPWGDCLQQDRGDGALVILPPGIPPHAIIAPLPERLRHLIRRHNRFATPQARLQVRAALNIGPVYRDEHGYSGEDINLVCRMLDARPLKRLLAGTDTELALMVSARVHDTIVLRHPSLIDPASFRPVRTRVKWTRIDAWISTLGSTEP